MGVSKVILNGQTLIDVTQKTVAADNLLSPNTALSAAGSDVVGEIATKSAATYTPSSATQTIPSGVYLTGVQTIEPIPISVDNHRLILPEGLISV